MCMFIRVLCSLRVASGFGEGKCRKVQRMRVHQGLGRKKLGQLANIAQVNVLVGG